MHCALLRSGVAKILAKIWLILGLTNGVVIFLYISELKNINTKGMTSWVFKITPSHVHGIFLIWRSAISSSKIWDFVDKEVPYLLQRSALSFFNKIAGIKLFCFIPLRLCFIPLRPSGTSPASGEEFRPVSPHTLAAPKIGCGSGMLK